MLKFLAGLFGILLLIPIALVVVALIICTLVGGYVGFVFHLCWEIILIVAAVIVTVKLVKYINDNKQK